MENWALEIEEKSLKGEGKVGSGSLMVRTSMERIDKLMVNETYYPIGNIANVATAGNEDAWLQKDRVYGGKWENWAYFTYTSSIA